jgi:predicted nucleotidyltransferase
MAKLEPPESRSMATFTAITLPDEIFRNFRGMLLGIKVIPPVVLMLLKVVAFMDDPARRAKDLEDIRGLLHSYESDNQERIFPMK